MTTRIIAAGSNELNAAEVLHVVRRIVGSSIFLRSTISSKLTGTEDTDLYVCAVTQKETLLSIVPPGSLSVLDLRPTAEFFIALSRIPVGETVYIFNSNDRMAHLLADMCREYHIHLLHFETIAYEDMPQQEVLEKLQKARYIIGIGRIVDKEVLLSPRYAPYLREDVTIIGCMRMATMETACELIENVAAIEGSSFDSGQLQQQLLNTLAGQFSDTLHAVDDLGPFSNSHTLTSMLKQLEEIISRSQILSNKK